MEIGTAWVPVVAGLSVVIVLALMAASLLSRRSAPPAVARATHRWQASCL